MGFIVNNINIMASTLIFTFFCIFMAYMFSLINKKTMPSSLEEYQFLVSTDKYFPLLRFVKQLALNPCAPIRTAYMIEVEARKVLKQIGEIE